MKEKPGKLKEKPEKPNPSASEKPGKLREQPNMKENVKNVNYKRDLFVCKKNRNWKSCDWRHSSEQKLAT